MVAFSRERSVASVRGLRVGSRRLGATLRESYSQQGEDLIVESILSSSRSKTLFTWTSERPTRSGSIIRTCSIGKGFAESWSSRIRVAVADSRPPGPGTRCSTSASASRGRRNRTTT